MSDSVSPESTKQAQELIDNKLVTPLDELSTFSVTAVADAAELVAKAKLEAAARAADAAREAMARVAAMKAAAATSSGPTAVPPAVPSKPVADTVKAVETPTPARSIPPMAAETEPVATEATPPPAAMPVSSAPSEMRAADSTDVPAERRTGDRRVDEPRRVDAERRTQDRPINVERRIDERRMSLGRRDDDPSGVFRLADAVRASSSAQADKRRSVTHDEEVKVPGRVLEPVARKAGHGPSRSGAKRKVFTPKLVFLFVLMGLFGMYATGNLPQFDQWTDSMVNKAHANNDVVVGAIASNWHTEAYIAMGVLLALIVFFIWNSLRARDSD